MAGQTSIDRRASLALRAAAQGQIAFITYGVGMFAGSWPSAVVVDHYAQPGAGGLLSSDWPSIRLFAAGTSGVVLITFLVTFFEPESREASAPAVEAMAGVPL